MYGKWSRSNLRLLLENLPNLFAKRYKEIPQLKINFEFVLRRIISWIDKKNQVDSNESSRLLFDEDNG